MFNRYCIYCDSILSETDRTCKICGARIKDETCFKKRFNYIPLLKGLITILIVRIILEALFGFMPYKMALSIIIGTVYTGKSYKISSLSFAIGGAMGLVAMIIGKLFVFANAYDFIIGILIGIVGMAIGGYIRQ